jgi:nucleotide-binding universal stress UspA family protein
MGFNDLNLPASPTELPSRSIRTILFATDFSETSHAAQSYALELAKHLGATLHVLHVVNPSSGSRVEHGDTLPQPWRARRRVGEGR